MTIRHDWSRDEVAALFERPFSELLFSAQQLHRAHHAPDTIQVSALLSIKTGACPEDCGYCPQSAHHDTALERERLMAVDEVIAAARARPAAAITSSTASSRSRSRSVAWCALCGQ